MKETPQNVQNPASKERSDTKNYLLLFKTYYGGLLGWNAKSSLPVEDIPGRIEAAAREWVSSPEGKKYVEQEGLQDLGVDYAHALMNVPFEMLARHGIEMWASVYEIVELDSDINLLPNELRRGVNHE